MLVLAIAALFHGRAGAAARPAFQFPRDTLAVTNETAWVYGTDPVSGRPIHTPRVPAPSYSLHCFVLARTAKQFRAHAEFRPGEPRLSAVDYRQRVAAVVARSPRTQSPATNRISFPGFSSVREFSTEYPELIRNGAGRAWRSYLQRGNWRMILPFTRRGQQLEAGRLAAEIRAGDTPVVHLCEFPRLGINHAMLFYEVEITATGFRFATYDPNDPGAPVFITYHQDRGFFMPPVPYYAGGPIHAYEVYRNWNR